MLEGETKTTDSGCIKPEESSRTFTNLFACLENAMISPARGDARYTYRLKEMLSFVKQSSLTVVPARLVMPAPQLRQK